MRLETAPRFLGGARADLVNAQRWYNARGLGQQFHQAFDDAVTRIVELPHAAPLWPGLEPLGVRRHIVRDYPYSIAYIIELAGWLILAVAHHRRRPKYWLSRLRKLER